MGTPLSKRNSRWLCKVPNLATTLLLSLVLIGCQASELDTRAQVNAALVAQLERTPQPTPRQSNPPDEVPLLIGVHTKNDVRGLLGEPSSDPGLTSINGKPTWWYLRNDQMPLDRAIVFEGNVVSEIHINVKPGLTVEKVVALLGPPQVVQVFGPLRLEDQSVPTWGALMYPSLGLEFEFPCSSNLQEPCMPVRRTTPIFSKGYFMPTSLADWYRATKGTPPFQLHQWVDFAN